MSGYNLDTMDYNIVNTVMLRLEKRGVTGEVMLKEIRVRRLKGNGEVEKVDKNKISKSILRGDPE